MSIIDSNIAITIFGLQPELKKKNKTHFIYYNVILDEFL